MRLGVISDIHGNLPALEAVWQKLEDKHQVDATVCLGDILGILGWPEETATFVQRNCDYVVYGNHDARLMEQFAFVPESDNEKEEHDIVTSMLTEETLEWLNTQVEDRLQFDNVYAAHAHPFEKPHHGYPAIENKDIYVDKRKWTKFGAEYLSDLENTPISLFGHTHIQGQLNLSKFDGQKGVICNPGSVGVPWFKDARYAVVDTEEYTAELHRAYYDTSKIKTRFKKLGLE
jgi:putative phosphoesterase